MRTSLAMMFVRPNAPEFSRGVQLSFLNHTASQRCQLQVLVRPADAPQTCA